MYLNIANVRKNRPDVMKCGVPYGSTMFNLSFIKAQADCCNVVKRGVHHHDTAFRALALDLMLAVHFNFAFIDMIYKRTMILIELIEPLSIWGMTCTTTSQQVVRLNDNFISVTSVRFKTSSFTCTSFDFFSKYECNIDSETVRLR